ncbi:MAG: hypothetical protein ABF459_17000, partial [Gluconobacter cerinus]|uniref:hypothetical protein n=1 Tax=Gluconobacter cerinus TaxID=38307 RepID=UPI0039E76973
RDLLTVILGQPAETAVGIIALPSEVKPSPRLYRLRHTCSPENRISIEAMIVCEEGWSIRFPYIPSLDRKSETR